MNNTITHPRNSPEYNSWGSMKQRCYNPKSVNYKNYGGRGITVCPEWLHSFETFLKDVGKKPFHYYSLDRINIEGNYEPSNCRWEHPINQQCNKRNNTFLTYNGRTETISEWTRILKFPRGLISVRINKLKWPIDKALFKRPQRY